MSETYQAWDNNEYPWPPPEGWYQATDGLWWPQGYGPGAAEDSVEPGPAPQAPKAQPDPALGPQAIAPAAVQPPASQIDIQSPAQHGVPGMAPAPSPAPGMAPPPGGAPPAGAAPLDAPAPAAYSAVPPPGSAPLGAAEPGPYGAPLGFEQPSTLGAAPGTAVAMPNEVEKDKSKTGLLVGLGLLVAVLLVGLPVLGYLALRGSDSDDAADGTTATTVAPGETGGQSNGPPPGVGAGSLDQPWAVGDPIIVSYQDKANDFADAKWTVKVTSSVLDATAAVVAENEFNEAPAAGRVYALVPITLTYKAGPEPMSVSDLSFKAIGPTGTVSSSTEDYCGVVENSFNSGAVVNVGDSISGNVCWAVDAIDLSQLKLFVEIDDASGVVYIDISG